MEERFNCCGTTAADLRRFLQAKEHQATMLQWSTKKRFDLFSKPAASVKKVLNQIIWSLCNLTDLLLLWNPKPNREINDLFLISTAILYVFEQICFFQVFVWYYHRRLDGLFNFAIWITVPAEPVALVLFVTCRDITIKIRRQSFVRPPHTCPTGWWWGSCSTHLMRWSEMRSAARSS